MPENRQSLIQNFIDLKILYIIGDPGKMENRNSDLLLKYQVMIPL